jgi:pilus assembly protein CpaE
LDISTVRDTAILYRQLLDMHLSPDRIKIVVNRVARQWALTVDDLQQSVGADVALELPDDQATALAAINEGVPLLLSRGGTPLAKALQDLGQIIEDAMAKERG